MRQIIVGYAILIQDRGLEFLQSGRANAASVRMPNPPPCAAPRILATGVPILGLPVFATLPMNVKAPRVRLNKTLPVLFGSQSNLLRATRALNRAPSLKAMPTSRSDTGLHHVVLHSSALGGPTTVDGCRHHARPAVYLRLGGRDRILLSLHDSPRYEAQAQGGETPPARAGAAAVCG